MSPNLPADKNQAASPDGAKAPAALSAKGAGRRRFGLGASGVIATLASKSGMATGLYCGPVSGWHSASSRVKTDVSGCMGYSQGYWKKPDRPWPSGVSRTQKFSSIFPGSVGGVQDWTLGQLVDGTASDDTWNLRCEFVVAYLNAVQKLNQYPSESDLKAIWSNYLMNYPNYRIVSNGELIGGEALKNYLAASHD